jgi:hypothetical protein
MNICTSGVSVVRCRFYVIADGNIDQATAAHLPPICTHHSPPTTHHPPAIHSTTPTLPPTTPDPRPSAHRCLTTSRSRTTLGSSPRGKTTQESLDARCCPRSSALSSSHSTLWTMSTHLASFWVPSLSVRESESEFLYVCLFVCFCVAHSSRFVD